LQVPSLPARNSPFVSCRHSTVSAQPADAWHCETQRCVRNSSGRYWNGRVLPFVSAAAVCLRIIRRSRRRRRTALYESLRQQDQQFAADLPGQQELPKLTDEEYDQLRTVHKVQRQEQHGSVGWGFLVMDVPTPPRLILDALASFDEYPDRIPVVRGARVNSLGHLPDGVLHARCTYWVSRFWLKVSVVHTFDAAAGLLRFNLDESVSQPILRDVTGFWYVEPLPGQRGSRVWLRVGVGASPLVPMWIVNYAAERALRRATSWLEDGSLS